MATYRYYTADLLTGAIQAELPLLGVSMSRQLSAAGMLSGTFQLGSTRYDGSLLLDGTTPEKTAIYCQRDDTFIWGGILWGRTYNSSDKKVTLSASTFESYFDAMVIEEDFIKQEIDQLQIFKDLIDTLQLQSYSDIGLDTSEMATSSGVLRTVLVPGYEFHYAQETVSTLVSADNAFDYMIDVVPSGTQDQPTKLVRVGYPQLGQGAAASITYDYPGSIINYQWPEQRGGTKFAVLGNGSGSSMLRAVSEATELLAAGYPAWWIVKAYKSLYTQGEVSLKAGAVRDLFKAPIVVPNFTLKSDQVPGFDAWSALGNSFNVHIEDDRFPDGKDVTSRMIGWQLQPTGADGLEKLTFAIEGDSDG